IRTSVENTGLKIRDIVLEPLASSEAVLTKEEKEVGVALVDIGGGTTDIAVFYDGIVIHTAVIPFGGNIITKDIKELFGILEEQAEKLKVQFGNAMKDYVNPHSKISVRGISGRTPKEISFYSLAEIIQCRVDEIINAIKYEIDSSGVSNKLGAGIVLTGGGALLKQLPQLVSFRTGKETKIGYPNENVDTDNEELKHTMFATGVGLLIKGKECIDFNGEINNTFSKNFVKAQSVTTPVVEPPKVENSHTQQTQQPQPKQEKPLNNTTSKRKEKQYTPSLFEQFKGKLNQLFDVDDNDTKIE
ncbi:MAG: cell division protein FtsA, partial [Bacteroidales bacterium]